MLKHLHVVFTSKKEKLVDCLNFTTVMLDNGDVWKHVLCHLHKNRAGAFS